MHVQQTIKHLHNKKVLALFIKLDISKAFDTVNWSYLLDIMTFLGFGPRWRAWVSSIWATTSSSFMVNGEQEKRIHHKRGRGRAIPIPDDVSPGHGTAAIALQICIDHWCARQIATISEYQYMWMTLQFL
jgi:hypothetical protein